MVYTKTWATFQSQCLELYAQNPTKTRYLIKAHPATQWLTLKVTDDKTVIKFKTRSAAILNRFETFNKDLAARMVGLPLPSQLQAEAAAASAAASSSAMDVDGDAGGRASQAGKAAGAGGAAAGSGTGGGGGGGGGGKKKKKKGKK